MKFRKGRIVKYIGTENELMIGKTYEVKSKSGNRIEIYAPLKYLGGEIHNVRTYMDIKDFEIIR